MFFQKLQFLDFFVRIIKNKKNSTGDEAQWLSVCPASMKP
jgi:hypothetical protein